MVVVVVGSRGFIGRVLVTELETAGHEVLGLTSSAPGGIDAESGLPSQSFALPIGTSTVVYLAQSPHYRSGPQMGWHLDNVNVKSAIFVAEQARRLGVKRFIYASTGSVYAPSFEPLPEDAPLARAGVYPLSKIAAEQALRKCSGIEVIIVRPFGVFGPGQRQGLTPTIIDRVRGGKAVLLAPHPERWSDDGGLRVSLCYVGDAVAIVRTLVEQGGPDVLNIAGPVAISVRELAEVVAAKLGKEVRFERGVEARTGDLHADVGRLRQAVGTSWIALEEALARTLAVAGEPDRPS